MRKTDIRLPVIFCLVFLFPFLGEGTEIVSLGEGYGLRLVRSEETTLQLIKEGGVVESIRAAAFYPMMPEAGEGHWSWPERQLPRDLNADGCPEFIVQAHSLGAHCCRTLYLFRLGNDPVLMDVLPLGNARVDAMEDLDHDGAVDIISRDDLFAYWRAPYALSPMPRVVFSIGRKGFRVNRALMERPPPSSEQWRRWLASVRSAPDWRDHSPSPPPRLWEIMASLIYQGHPRLADRFLEEAWVLQDKERSAFAEDFYDLLTTNSKFLNLNESGINHDYNEQKR